MSLGERITLVQSCLPHILNCFLALFKIPTSVASKIENLQKDFLWLRVGEGKKDHLINLDIVCRLKQFGGLGFRKTTMRNHVISGKWLRRFPMISSILWH